MSRKQDHAHRKPRRAASRRKDGVDGAPRLGNAIAQAPGSESTGAAGSKPRAMPEEIRRRFTHKRDAYYFADGKRAFRDRGRTLTTRSEHAQVIRSLAAIAKMRRWRAVTVTGTQRFRRRMWLAARLANIVVAGFTPDAQLQAQLERERALRARHRAPPLAAPPARAGVASPEPPPLAPSQTPRPTPIPAAVPREWRGRLIDHGEAPYQHQVGNAMSYFIKLQTREGERALWGVDLKRALRASVSRPAPGDAVVLRRVGQDEVTLRVGAGDEASRQTHRHRYAIETSDFWARRAEAAPLMRDASVSARAATQRFPELVGTYLQLHAAQLTAQRLSHTEDQRRFVDRVRGAIANSIARGEPFGTVRMRARARALESAATRDARAAEPQRG